MPELLDLHGQTNKILRALADTALQRHGLHLGQDHLLALLWERDGRTPGELASALQVTAPTVVKMATRMASAGLLTRRREDKDNRLVRLWLTERGRALQQPVEAERERIDQRYRDPHTARAPAIAERAGQGQAVGERPPGADPGTGTTRPGLRKSVRPPRPYSSPRAPPHPSS